MVKLTSKLVKWVCIMALVGQVLKRLPNSIIWKLKMLIARLPVQLPFLGSVQMLLAATHDINTLILTAARAEDFEGGYYEVPGVKVATMFERDEIEYVLKDNWENFLKNEKNIQIQIAFKEMLGKGIFAVDGEEWKVHRKVASFLFSRNALRNKMEQVFQKHAADLVKELPKIGKPFDLQMVMAAFTFDTICEIAFGHHPGALQEALNGRKLPFLQAFDDAQQSLSYRIPLPDPLWMFMRRFNLGWEGRLKKDIKLLNDYVAKIVKQRKEEISASNLDASDVGDSDLLTLFILHAKKTKDQSLESEDYLRDVVLNFMIAGRDTTSFTLTNAFKLLSEHPEEEELLLEELAKKTDLGFDGLRDCPRLDACINETLRMYPPVGVDFRICVQDDVLPTGREVTAGTLMLSPTFAIGRNPKLFEEPDTFKPDRWISDNKVDFVSEYTMPIFWGGPRICLGKEAARLELKIVLSSVLPHVKINTNAYKKEDSFLTSPVMFHRDGITADCRMRDA